MVRSAAFSTFVSDDGDLVLVYWSVSFVSDCSSCARVSFLSASSILFVFSALQVLMGLLTVGFHSAKEAIKIGRLSSF